MYLTHQSRLAYEFFQKKNKKKLNQLTYYTGQNLDPISKQKEKLQIFQH